MIASRADQRGREDFIEYRGTLSGAELLIEDLARLSLIVGEQPLIDVSGASSGGSSPSATLKNSISATCLPTTARQTVRGVERIRPGGASDSVCAWLSQPSRRSRVHSGVDSQAAGAATNGTTASCPLIHSRDRPDCAGRPGSPFTDHPIIVRAARRGRPLHAGPHGTRPKTGRERRLGGRRHEWIRGRHGDRREERALSGRVAARPGTSWRAARAHVATLST